MIIHKSDKEVLNYLKCLRFREGPNVHAPHGQSISHDCCRCALQARSAAEGER